jgi:uncharacterized protein (TIGR02453 family)
MAADRFTGFGDEALDFYVGLSADNSKAYWQAHKPTYDAAVAGPMRALAEELGPDFGEYKIFRPYRDVRFAADKRPYKENAAMAFDPPGGGLLYFHLDVDGLMLAGGYYEPARDQLARWRRLQDEPTITRELDEVMARLAARGYPLGEGDPLKTAPRGWPKDHPRIELLRRRRLEAYGRHDPGPWLHSRELVDVVREGFTVLQDWNAWLARRVGPSDEPLDPRGTSRSR